MNSRMILSPLLTFVLQEDVDDLWMAVGDGQVEGGPTTRIMAEVNLLGRLDKLLRHSQSCPGGHRRSGRGRGLAPNQRRRGVEFKVT